MLDGVWVALWTRSPGEQEGNELQVSGLLPLRGRVQGQLSVVEGIDTVSSLTHTHTPLPGQIQSRSLCLGI